MKANQNVLMLEQVRDAMLRGEDLGLWNRSKRLDCAARLNGLAELVADWERASGQEGAEREPEPSALAEPGEPR